MRKPIMAPRGKFRDAITLRKEGREMPEEAEDFDYQVTDILPYDDGTMYCKCLLLKSGEVQHVQEFSSYQAVEDATSFGQAYVEASTYSLQERLGPFGIEWEREQHERLEGETNYGGW